MPHKIKKPLRLISNGEPICIIQKSEIQKNSESALAINLIANRHLFGHFFSGVFPNFREIMLEDTGVLIKTSVPSELFGWLKKPGDIDILIIPYDKNYLLLDKIMAVEIKIVRASFVSQEKSPNQFGLSQALGLLEMGFPYVSLSHLIVSDTSPKNHWKQMDTVRILDEAGRCEIVAPMLTDPMPYSLLQRNFGKLRKSCLDYSEIGLASIYTDWSAFYKSSDSGITFPIASKASLNKKLNPNLLRKIADYFDIYQDEFLNTPSFT